MKSFFVGLLVELGVLPAYKGAKLPIVFWWRSVKEKFRRG